MVSQRESAITAPMFKRPKNPNAANKKAGLTKRTQFILGSTALFTIVEMLVFLPFF